MSSLEGTPITCVVGAGPAGLVLARMFRQFLGGAEPDTRPRSDLIDSSRHVNYIHMPADRKALQAVRSDFGWQPYPFGTRG